LMSNIPKQRLVFFKEMSFLKCLIVFKRGLLLSKENQ